MSEVLYLLTAGRGHALTLLCSLAGAATHTTAVENEVGRAPAAGTGRHTAEVAGSGQRGAENGVARATGTKAVATMNMTGVQLRCY